MSGSPPRFDLPKKPTYKKLAEDVDVFAVFRTVEARCDTCFFLESLADDGDTSRYSVIGFSPVAVVSGRGTVLTVEQDGRVDRFETANPYDELRKMIPQDVLSRDYAGGLVGYLSYEAANYFEPALSLRPHPDFDPFRFGVYTDGLVFDTLTGEIFYFYYDRDRSSLVEEFVAARPPEAAPPSVEISEAGLGRDAHREVVERVREYVRTGRIYQAEVGFRTGVKIEGGSVGIYAKLRDVNPSPFMFYVKFGDQVVLGASPEMLFRLRHGEMSVYPLAGSIGRGATPDDDRRLARKLLNDPKETSEHAMLVDLHRNDLGRVASFGTVKVRELMTLRRFRYVQHIASEVTGVIRPGEDMFSGLAANFPMGTVTGAPKIEAMRVIAENEGEPRGPYAGGVGHFGFNGDCTFCVQLRSLFRRADRAYVQACGGIVYDSDPDAEYDEIGKKLAGMLAVLESFGGGR